MIEQKYWYDFNKDRQVSKPMLIIYGASYSGQGFLEAGILPDLFCDRQARSIKQVTYEEGTDIPVVTPEELPHSIDADILVATLCKDEEMTKSIMNDVIKVMDSKANRLRFYLEPKDVGDSYYEIGNKIAVVDEQKYVELLAEQMDKENGVEINFFDKELPFRERGNFYKYGKLCFRNNRLEYEDLTKEYVSFQNGKRVTAHQPESFDHTVHIFGNSRVVNQICKDEDTMCSQLQEFINRENLPLKVENCAISGLKIAGILHQIQHTQLRKGDFIFVVGLLEIPYERHSVREDRLEDIEVFCTYLSKMQEYCKSKDCYFVFVRIEGPYGKQALSTWEERFFNRRLNCRYYPLHSSSVDRKKFYLERKKKSAIIKIYCGNHGILYYDCVSQLYMSEDPIFYDGSHWGDYGNKILAEEIYHIICAMEHSEAAHKTERSRIEKRVKEEKREALLYMLQRAVIGYDDYSAQVKKYKRRDAKYAGAVVMNCNPFTKGHRYLIETAALQVDVLYLFVVEEDKSIFPFIDRFELVKENTKDIPNVVVLPSGKFIISSITFPDYFYKESILENQKIDTSLDLLIFALKIAKEMDIKVRFVGEEPFDLVTRRYNEQMKQILPEYDIEVIEMERARNQEKVISASAVRKLLQEGEFEELKCYVPDPTYQYLVKKEEI